MKSNVFREGDIVKSLVDSGTSKIDIPANSVGIVLIDYKDGSFLIKFFDTGEVAALKAKEIGLVAKKGKVKI